MVLALLRSSNSSVSLQHSIASPSNTRTKKTTSDFRMIISASGIKKPIAIVAKKIKRAAIQNPHVINEGPYFSQILRRGK